MIAASDPQEFVPSGRQQALKHPNIKNTENGLISRFAEDLILNDFEKVSLKERKDNEWWVLRKKNLATGSEKVKTESKPISPKTLFNTYTENLEEKPLQKENLDLCCMEEELYVKGNIAIWTKGLNTLDPLNNSFKTVAVYTTPSPIQQAFWCTFYSELPILETDFEPVFQRKENDGVEVPALCVFDSYNIRVFAQNGEDFITAAPFEVEKLWSCKYGILLEKQFDSANMSFYEGKASLYSLSFPLEEVRPIVIAYGSNLQLLNNTTLKLLYTNENPSICMCYDNQTKRHSVYFIRKITNSERIDMENKLNCTARSAASLSKSRNRPSMWDCLKNSNYLVAQSPISRAGSVASFHNVPTSRSLSSMATISRLQSPMMSSIEGSKPHKASRLSCSIPFNGTHSMYNLTECFKPSFKLSLCLEHLWTESNPSDDNSGAFKVFLYTDLIDTTYLCYMVTNKLNLLKMDGVGQFIHFSGPKSISAKDAAPIPMLKMLAVLEQNGNVCLYNGFTPVGKLHIGGTLVQHTPSPYIRRNLPQFNSPFPRRSSLLPHCKVPDLKFDEHLLSPVLPETPQASRGNNVLQLNFQVESNVPKTVLNGLRDPVENRLTLRYSDGTYYRISLPPLTNSLLVTNCIECLKFALTKDTSSMVLARWYAVRNSPGSQDLNLEQEWDLFQSLLLDLLGYETHGHEFSEDYSTPSSNPKRQKHSVCSNDDDWVFMLRSPHNTALSKEMNNTFKLNLSVQAQRVKSLSASHIYHSALLFPSIKLLLYTFHLLYENLKLDTYRSADLRKLVGFLAKLAKDLSLRYYVVHYWKDFPDICPFKSKSLLNEPDRKHILDYSCIEERPPSIFEYINGLITGKLMAPFRCIETINRKSRDVIEITGILLKEIRDVSLNQLIEVIEDNFSIKQIYTSENSGSTPQEQAILLMTNKHMTVQELDCLPPAIYLLFYALLWKCRNNPPPDLPSEAYYLLWRDDLAAQTLKSKSELARDRTARLQDLIPSPSQTDPTNPDGMEDIENALTRLRFSEDVRVNEARKMLQSSKPVPILLVQRPVVSDHDFIEEQEKHLYAICGRTMALSVGRGMFTLRTSTPVVTEPLQMPQVCLTGRGSPRGTTVELNHIDTPLNMNSWPLFHNGVANGLRISKDARDINDTWITFNKAKDSVDQQMEHAGFLMALGLNGHLKNLEVLNTYDYLLQLHEMTSIGLLLGLSVVYRGTSSMALTKTLSIHMEALLPPTSMELDVNHNVQIAALLGIGLVYQGSCHRHIIEVLLSEIGRPPGPEMENSVDRESYSLAAGLSLGLVTLKQGSTSLGLSDLNISDTLYYYMVGGQRRSLTGTQKDKYKVPSFQIREGSCVNLDVTAPGATIALGLMYLGSGNKSVADWMTPPQTQYLLDFVRPDFLMFRVLSRALILWDDIKPTKNWIEDQVPASFLPYCMVKPPPHSNIDYEAMNQAYCNIVTGACFALGLKYAGSGNVEAFQSLLHFCHVFTNLTLKPIADLAGKPTVETCLNVLLLSVAMVMAGTGNIKVMRLIRLLRRRVGVTSSSVVTYGSHLATHMALGLLFLGGGRYTLSNSPASVAALITAFYPKFPTHSNDNRYHLQAFRHLYVLAVEPRLLIPKDVHSNNGCYTKLKIVNISGETTFLKAPDIIPDLDTLKTVEIDDERYWPVVFKRGKNWDTLLAILRNNGFIEVQQRAGCLSYIADKFGYHSQLAKTLTQSEAVPWDPLPSSITSFTHDEAVKYFCKLFLPSDNQLLTQSTYDAVIKDKLIIVPVISFLLKSIAELESTPNSLNFWQIKIIFSQVLTTSLSSNLLSPEIALALKYQILRVLNAWEMTLLQDLQCYLSDREMCAETEVAKKLGLYISYFDIPFKESFKSDNFLECLLSWKNRYSAETIDKLAKITAC